MEFVEWGVWTVFALVLGSGVVGLAMDPSAALGGAMQNPQQSKNGPATDPEPPTGIECSAPVGTDCNPGPVMPSKRPRSDEDSRTSRHHDGEQRDPH